MNHKTLTQRIVGITDDAVTRNMNDIAAASINDALRIDREGNLSNHAHNSSPNYVGINLYEQPSMNKDLTDALKHPAASAEDIRILCDEHHPDYANTTSKLQLRQAGNQLLQQHVMQIGRKNNIHFPEQGTGLLHTLYQTSEQNLEMLETIMPGHVAQLPRITHPTYDQ